MRERRQERFWGGGEAWEGEIFEVLGHLKEKYRIPLFLHHVDGHSQEEVAKMLGLPPGTIMSRLHRGREMLRQRLGQRGYLLSLAAVLAWLDGWRLEGDLAEVPGSGGATGVKDLEARCSGTSLRTRSRIEGMAKGAERMLFWHGVVKSAVGLVAVVGLAVFAGSSMTLQGGEREPRERPAPAPPSKAVEKEGLKGLDDLLGKARRAPLDRRRLEKELLGDWRPEVEWSMQWMGITPHKVEEEAQKMLKAKQAIDDRMRQVAEKSGRKIDVEAKRLEDMRSIVQNMFGEIRSTLGQTKIEFTQKKMILKTPGKDERCAYTLHETAPNSLRMNIKSSERAYVASVWRFRDYLILEGEGMNHYGCKYTTKCSFAPFRFAPLREIPMRPASKWPRRGSGCRRE